MTGSQRGGHRTHPGPGGKHPRDKTWDERQSVDPQGAKLSKEKHDKLMSEGRCFICKEMGHMSRQCPKWMMVPSGSRDKPPGVPNYTVHIETNEISEQQLLDESTEVLTKIPLSMACFRYETPGSRGSRTVEILNDPMGNPLAQQAEEVLRRHMPYPRDDLRGEETLSDKRFHIYRISETHHVIMDRAAHLWEDVEIPTSLLLNLDFCVSDWYAKWYEPCRQNHEAMGDALGHHVAFLLNRERHFPGNHSANQFSCEHIETRGKVLYEIIDQELDMHLWTNEQFLCNEKLNITHWYARNLWKGYI
jgi:hypothetical protein